MRTWVGTALMLLLGAQLHGQPVPMVGEAATIGSATSGTGAVGAGATTGSGVSGPNLTTNVNAPTLGSNIPTMPTSHLAPRIVPGGANGGVTLRPSAELALPTGQSPAISPSGSFRPRVSAEDRASVKPTGGTDAGVGKRVADPRKTTGVDSLDKAVKEIEKGRKEETKGRDGGITAKLDKLFDFSRRRTDGGLGLPQGADVPGLRVTPVAGLPDPKIVGVKQALGKITTLAREADPADAPYLYQRAVDVAGEQLSGSEGRTKVATLRREASGRAPGALDVLGKRALAAAAQGRTTDALRYTKSLHAWDNLLAGDGGSYILNFPQLAGAVKHVLREALAKPGVDLPAPDVRFEPVSKGGGVKALVALPEGISQVAALPADFAEALALPGAKSFVALEDVSLPEGVSMSAAFGLTPQGGFRDFYRAQRRAKRSIWSSFWIAARQYLSAALSGLWQRVKAAVVFLLQKMGILRGAVGGMAVDVSDLDRLRALEGADAVLPSSHDGLGEDALGLGYRLFPT